MKCASCSVLNLSEDFQFKNAFNSQIPRDK